MGTGGGQLRLLVVPAARAPRVPWDQPGRVLDWLEDAGGSWWTEAEIAQGTGMSRSEVHLGLTLLRAAWDRDSREPLIAWAAGERRDGLVVRLIRGRVRTQAEARRISVAEMG